MPSPHVKEPKALLDSRFHALDSGFHVLYMFFVGGSCFLDSSRGLYRHKSGTQESGFFYIARAMHFTATAFKPANSRCISGRRFSLSEK